jgi:hypothetical protein
VENDKKGIEKHSICNRLDFYLVFTNKNKTLRLRSFHMSFKVAENHYLSSLAMKMVIMLLYTATFMEKERKNSLAILPAQLLNHVSSLAIIRARAGTK